MTFWPLTNSDFLTDQTFHQFHDLYTDFDLHRIMSGFHGAFATSVASQEGTLTLPDTWFRPPLFGLACAPIVETRFLKLVMSYSTFHLEYPLVLSRYCLLLFFTDHTVTVHQLIVIFGQNCITYKLKQNVWWYCNHILLKYQLRHKCCSGFGLRYYRLHLLVCRIDSDKVWQKASAWYPVSNVYFCWGLVRQ